MEHITQEQVSKEITHIINKKINEFKRNDDKYRNHYESVMEELESEIKDSEELIGYLTEENLSISRIGEEGYLRCLKHIVGMFREWEKDI